MTLLPADKTLHSWLDTNDEPGVYWLDPLVDRDCDRYDVVIEAIEEALEDARVQQLDASLIEDGVCIRTNDPSLVARVLRRHGFDLQGDLA